MLPLDFKRAVQKWLSENLYEIKHQWKEQWFKIPPQQCDRPIKSDRKQPLRVIAAKGSFTNCWIMRCTSYLFIQVSRFHFTYLSYHSLSCLSPAFIGWEAGHTLDKSPVDYGCCFFNKLMSFDLVSVCENSYFPLQEPASKNQESFLRSISTLIFYFLFFSTASSRKLYTVYYKT